MGQSIDMKQFVAVFAAQRSWPQVSVHRHVVRLQCGYPIWEGVRSQMVNTMGQE